MGGAVPVVHEEMSSPVFGRPSVSISAAAARPRAKNGRRRYILGEEGKKGERRGRKNTYLTLVKVEGTISSMCGLLTRPKRVHLDLKGPRG